MKRIFFLAASALLGCAAVSAQEANYYNFRDLKVLDLDDEMTSVWGSITSVSNDGKYAVGSDWDLTYHSWLWQAIGAEGEPTYATTSERPADNIVLAINDAGMGVGSFYDETIGMVVPGYRTLDGAWHRLEQPAYAQTMNQTWKKGQYNDSGLPYIPTAYYVSNDGKHIGGWTYAAGGSDDDRPGFDAKLHGFFWHLNDAGEYVLQDLTDLDLSETQQGFRPYAMNEEGTIMAGLVQRDDNGIFEPAAIIDGQLVIVIEATAGDFSEAGEKGTDEGSCFSVSGRNIYGYGAFTQYDAEDPYAEGTRDTYSFRYNADTKQLDKLPGLCVKVANSEGQCLAIDPTEGGLYIVESDFATVRRLDCPVQISDVLSASDDFSVLGGVAQTFTDYGIINTPILVRYLDAPDVVGVGRPAAAPQGTMDFDLLGRRAADGNHGIRIVNGHKLVK